MGLNIFKKLGLAVAAGFSVVMLSLPAQAVSLTPGGPVVDILSASEFTFEEITPAGAGPQSFSFDFTSSELPQAAQAIEVNLTGEGLSILPTLEFTNTATNAVISTAVFEEIEIAGVVTGVATVLFTNFTAANLFQTLTLGYTPTGPDSLQVSLQVSPVPVPPALLLLGTGIAGFGFVARYRRKKQNSKDQLAAA